MRGPRPATRRRGPRRRRGAESRGGDAAQRAAAATRARPSVEPRRPAASPPRERPPLRGGLSTWQPRRCRDRAPDYPRGSRGGAATRPRNIHAAPAAEPTSPRRPPDDDARLVDHFLALLRGPGEEEAPGDADEIAQRVEDDERRCGGAGSNGARGRTTPAASTKRAPRAGPDDDPGVSADGAGATERGHRDRRRLDGRSTATGLDARAAAALGLPLTCAVPDHSNFAKTSRCSGTRPPPTPRRKKTSS